MVKNKSNEINFGGVVYIIIHLITFVAATFFVVENFMHSEEGIKSVLFGAFLMFMMVNYLVTEINRVKVFKLNSGEN